MAEPTLAQAQVINQTAQPSPQHRDSRKEGNESPRVRPHPATGDHRPPSRSSVQAPFQSPARAIEQDNTRNAPSHENRVRHRVSLESIGATLEFRAQSDSFRELQIFDSEKEKDTFAFSLRHPLSRTPTSDFSLSLGFSYLDESLLPPPLGERPPFIGAPGPGAPLTPPDSTLDRLAPSRRPLSSTGNPSARAARVQLQPSRSTVPSSESPDAILPRPSQPGDASDIMRTGVLHFSQNYRQRDESGQWLVRSQFNLGTELASAPTQMNADAQFFSWTGRLERVQTLSENNQLTLQLDTQLSPNNLLPPHQFKMKDQRFNSFEREGRPSEIAGNNGIRLRLEDRIILIQQNYDSPNDNRYNNEPIVALIPFLDLGYTWGQSNPRSLSQQFLGRAGLSLSMQPLTDFSFQVDYLTYWGDLREGSNNQDLYMTFGYQTAW